MIPPVDVPDIILKMWDIGFLEILSKVQSQNAGIIPLIPPPSIDKIL
jgi:hypothetical protein